MVKVDEDSRPERRYDCRPTGNPQTEARADPPQEAAIRQFLCGLVNR
ncbi:MAG: hypothetical protein ACFCVD_25155 [Nodosilinea sp.]